MAFDPLSAILSIGETIINKVWPDANEAGKAKIKLMELAQAGELKELELLAKQIEVNAEEAKHTSVFVAGWRPFVGWTCGSSLAWTFIVGPMLSFFTGWPIPVLDIGELMTILLGILGLGAYRTYEKKGGVEDNR